MASTVFPAASAAAKTQFRTTLTTGTSYTVPANVTYLNVTLVGGGGGGGYASSSTGVSACNGYGGQVICSTLSATAGNTIAYAIGAGGTGGYGAAEDGVAGGDTTFTGATTAGGGNGGTGAGRGNTNQKQTGIFSMGGNGGPTKGGGEIGGNGAAGYITVEYWA